MTIEEVDDDDEIVEEIKRSSDAEDDEKIVRPADFAKLIIPNKILPNKLPVAVNENNRIKKEHEIKVKREIEKKMDDMNKEIDIFAKNNECDDTKIGAFIEEL